MAVKTKARDINAEVARMVMGWRKERLALYANWVNEKGEFGAGWGWSPVSDIAHAFDVADEMSDVHEKLLQLKQEIGESGSPLWTAKFYSLDPEEVEDSETGFATASEAICRAALKALNSSED